MKKGKLLVEYVEDLWMIHVMAHRLHWLAEMKMVLGGGRNCTEPSERPDLWLLIATRASVTSHRIHIWQRFIFLIAALLYALGFETNFSWSGD